MAFCKQRARTLQGRSKIKIIQLLNSRYNQDSAVTWNVDSERVIIIMMPTAGGGPGATGTGNLTHRSLKG